MIQIDNNVAVPSMRRANLNKVTPALKNLMERYREAYTKVYGLNPTITWQNPWFKIAGSEQRVSRSRLLEMARQLEYRGG